jgi:Tat protein secretion system quality control protein TatD with DNase activity
VETDAPYIAPNGIRVNSPVYLGEVIEVVDKTKITFPLGMNFLVINTYIHFYR